MKCTFDFYSLWCSNLVNEIVRSMLSSNESHRYHEQGIIKKVISIYYLSVGSYYRKV